MTILEASVSQYSLFVDAERTIEIMVESADNPWGRRLYDALTIATGRYATYAVSPYVNISRDDFAPDRAERADIPEIGGRSVCAVLANLEAAGYVTARTVLHERPSEVYLSDGRIVTAVQVLKPFVVVTVDYRWSPEANRRVGWGTSVYADLWEIHARSYIMPAGWYLVGEVGEYSYDLVGVAGMAGDSDDTFGWLFELEGFGASHCLAECDACGCRWIAECGSWCFQDDGTGASSWYFDDADDCDEDTSSVGCPQCPSGRVNFEIY